MSRSEWHPAILAGAFDRHNLGDLLFAHVASALLPDRRLHVAGLAKRDLTPFGGHAVRPLREVCDELAGMPYDVIHAGGEILTCSAWEAAVMLQPLDQAQAFIRQTEHDEPERRRLTMDMLGTDSLAPYCLSRKRAPNAARLLHAGVGGVNLGQLPAAMRNEVLASLQEADRIGVRDGRTLQHLQCAGIPARLMPDPAVMVAELFGERIQACAEEESMRRVQETFPNGYLAVQFSADFGDDATLDLLAPQLDRVAAETGCGLAFFLAGAAPWHDDAEVYRRMMARLKAPCLLFGSMNIWSICALIAHCRAYLGSSLHGRIVAMAYARPRINFIREEEKDFMTKQTAYAATWENGRQPGAVSISQLAQGLSHALEVDPGVLKAMASDLAAQYRHAFSHWLMANCNRT